MSGLHLDNCVAKQVARLLIQAGYSVVTAAELGLKRAPDGRQLLEAAQQSRVLNAVPQVEVRYIDEIMASGWPLANELYRWRPRGGWVRHPTP